MLRRERLCALSLLCARVPEDGTFSRLRGKVRRAARALRRQRVRRVLVPEEFLFWTELAREGLAPVAPEPALRAAAAALALAALGRLHIPPQRACVALCGTQTEPCVWEIARRLCPSVRGLALDFPDGCAALARRLRAVYGLPVTPDAARADLTLRFAPERGAGAAPALELFGPEPELLGLRVGRAEGALPEGCAPLALLSVLLESGLLNADTLSVY